MNIEEVISKTNAKRVGDRQYLGHCPAHNDEHPSLSFRIENEEVILHCHAGCEYQDIINNLSVSKPMSFVSFGSEKNQDMIIKILSESSSIKGTLVETYLNARGIEL